MEDQVQDYVTHARELTRNRSFSKAFDVYILVFEKRPQLKNLYEVEFQSVVIKLNEVLVCAGDIEDIFNIFGRAIKVFPENTWFLNKLGKYLYKYGFYPEACCHFQKALKVDPSLVNAEKNLNSIKNLCVDRWHFRMLNDKIRNELYRTAIHESITPSKDSIVDIGTGTGLLALFAHECKPLAIMVCDANLVMTEIAECVFQDMGINDILTLNCMSTHMNFKDMGGKRSFLITEMFDAGLFGEHVLPTIAHAWENLLNSNARVLPCSAEFFVCAASCNELNLKYQLGVSAKTLLNMSDSYVHILTDNETYDCDDVNFFKDLKYITNTELLIKVDFNSYYDILDKLQKCEPLSIELKVIEDGEANTMIGWFNLHLTENVTLTTDPRSPIRCHAWQQAVFFDYIPKVVKQTDIITSNFLMNRGKLIMVTEGNSYIHRISPEMLRFLNDSEYMKMIMGCIGMACVYLAQIIDMSEIDMVDCCPFPLFGLQMLKRGAQSLICLARNHSDKEFILNVMRANDIDLSRITVLIDNDRSDGDFRDKMYHAIFCYTFELCGEINLIFKELAQNLKTYNLFPGGLFMPSTITLMVQLVDSHWLDINNRVYDENVCNFNISKYINKYQVSQYICLDISHLEYKPLTEPTSLGIYNSELSSEVVNIPVINNGSANAVLCWYKIEVMEDLGEISTNRPNSFIFSMAFLADPKVILEKGTDANVLRCVDPNGSFKLIIDDEATA